MSKEEFLDKIVNVLTDECELRNLWKPEQVTSFVTHAVNIQYGSMAKIPVSEIIANVYKNLHTGIKNLPKELPKELQPIDLNSEKINSKVRETIEALGKKYRGVDKVPKIDQIYKDAQMEIGLIDETGMALRLSNEEDNHIISKVTTMIGSAIDPNSNPNFEDEGLKSLYEVANKSIKGE